MVGSLFVCLFVCLLVDLFGYWVLGLFIGRSVYCLVTWPILIFLLGGEIIGMTRLDTINYLNQLANKISIIVRTEFRGKGYGTQILSQTCLYAKNKLPSKMLIAFVKKENKESISIFHKNGFEKVKTKNQIMELRKILK